MKKVFLPLISSIKASEYIEKNADRIKDLDKKLSDIISGIKFLASDNIIVKSLKNNRLYIDNFISAADKTSVKIKRESGVPVAEIVLKHSDISLSFCGNKYADFHSLRNDLINISNICDIRTLDEKRIEKSRNDLDILADDSSFTAYLTDKGFSLSSAVREDNDYFYYDIVSNDSGLKIGSFAVHKVTGEIYLTDHEEVPLSSLNMFSTVQVKKKTEF